MTLTALLIGNFFSLCTAICIAISVVKRNKIRLIWWQIWDTFFCILASLVLLSYSSFTTSILCMARNVAAYKKKLTGALAIALMLICVCIGLYANNRGVFGLFPILAFVEYTTAMYWTKNDQQMRYAVVINLSLWFIHDLYIQAYPSALTDVLLSLWTVIQIFRHIKRGKRMRRVAFKNA